jgi:chromosome segregation ATPase
VELNQQINIFQIKIQEYVTIINNYEIKIQEYTAIIHNQDVKIEEYTTIIHNYERELEHIKKIEAPPAPEPIVQTREVIREVIREVPAGVPQEVFDSLFLENGKKMMQIVILMEEINRLNHFYNQIREHLRRAEEHIQETQGYIAELERQVKVEAFKSTESNTYKIKNKELENKITYLNQQLQLFQQKDSQRHSEISQVENKYRLTISELNTQVTTLARERDVLSSKVEGNQELRDLQAKFEQQSLEMGEIVTHLATAEEYIKQNAELWAKANEAYELLPEKLQIIDMLKKDLEMTRKQNKELDERIVQLEKLVEMMENRKTSATNAAPTDRRLVELEQNLAVHTVTSTKTEEFQQKEIKLTH